MKTSSAKHKGRRLQQYVAEQLIKRFNLDPLDARSTSMGDTGSDIKLSSEALSIFPYAIECKNVEKVNIWQAWEQAGKHVQNMDRQGIQPLLVLKRNHSGVLAVVSFEHLIKLEHKLNEKG